MSDKIVNFKITDDIYRKLSSLARDMYGHGGIKKIYTDFSIDFVRKYEGKKSGKMDVYFDPSYIPKPEIDSGIDEKIIPWLRQLSTEELAKQTQISYQSYTWARALHSTPPGERLLVNFDLTTLWKKFR